MSHYLDIQLRPDPEFAAHQLMAALYAKLHRALVNTTASTVGVVFPQYSAAPAALGNVMRVFGPEAALRQLMQANWLAGMQDHVRITAVAAVPPNAAHRRLQRVQAKSNPARLRRRQMRRHGLSEAQAVQQVPDSAAKFLNLPFTVLRSTSTGQTFRLYLRLGGVLPGAVEGTFNAFGLSTTATVPWF